MMILLLFYQFFPYINLDYIESPNYSLIVKVNKSVFIKYYKNLHTSFQALLISTSKEVLTKEV